MGTVSSSDNPCVICEDLRQKRYSAELYRVITIKNMPEDEAIAYLMTVLHSPTPKHSCYRRIHFPWLYTAIRKEGE